MNEALIKALEETPTLLLFAFFLYLSFRQRERTMTMMSDMLTGFLSTMQECCDEDEKPT